MVLNIAYILTPQRKKHIHILVAGRVFNFVFVSGALLTDFTPFSASFVCVLLGYKKHLQCYLLSNSLIRK